MATLGPRRTLLRSCYTAALAKFCENDIQLIATITHEQAMAHRIALYLEQECRAQGEEINPLYVVDCEYNRNGNSVKRIVNGQGIVIPIRADIILHSRGQVLEQDNLLAMELKIMPARDAELESDRLRLMAMTENTFTKTFKWGKGRLPESVCRYKFGVYLLIDAAQGYIDQEYFYDGQAQGSGPRIDLTKQLTEARLANLNE